MKFLKEEFDGVDDFNSEDQELVTPEQENFAHRIFDLIQGIVDDELLLDESFVSKTSLSNHFYKHCLAGNTNKKSSYSNVYYDFKYINKYKQYEQEISNIIAKTPYIVPSLLDNKIIVDYIYKLFKGNCAILFPTICGFKNDKGRFMVGLYAFSSDVTKNYSTANTISIIIITPTGKTLSIYPLDAHYLESKLNSIIKTYSDINIEINFNRG